MSGRRGHGEGTVYKYKGGWAAAIHVGWRSGKRDRRFVYGKSQQEVLDKLKDIQRLIDSGQRIDVDMTLGEFLEHWITEIVPGTVRPSTENSYKDIVRRHIIPVIGKVKLRKLTPADVRKYLRAKEQETNHRGKPHSARSLQYMHAILRRALQQAMREELVLRNVAALVEPPRVRRVEVTPYTHEEAKRIIAAAKFDRIGALYVLALGLGLRKGEALALSWSDIDFENRTIQIKATLQRLRWQGVTISEPKTLRSRRQLPLPKFCLDALREHRNRQDRESETAEHWNNEFDLVFTTPIGTPLDPRNLTRSFNELCERANVPRLRFHDLRHTCASILFAQGADARTIMDTLGHSMIGTTMNLYTHIMPVTRRQAAERMDEALGSTNGSTGDEDPPDGAVPATV
jgi:integrase